MSDGDHTHAGGEPQALSGETQGERFGDYVLDRHLRTGAMAELFVAHRVETPDERIALKRLLPCHAEDPEHLEMFRHEGELAGIFRHPGIVRALDTGCIGDLPYLALELVDGPSLAALMRAARVAKEPLPEGFACHVARRVLAALHHAHERADASGGSLGVVHRDVTPGNILLTLDGEVKLCDFGLARSMLQRLRTRAGIAKGTHAYLSPEQTRLIEIDRRSDLFSLGTVLYEMLTGRYLFRAKQDYTTIARIRRAEVPPLSKLNPAVSRQVEAVVMRALERDREDRFATAAEMERALLRAQMAAGSTCTRGQAADFIHVMRHRWRNAEQRSRELAERAREGAVTGLHAFDHLAPPSSVSALPGYDEWDDPIESDPASELGEPVRSDELRELSEVEPLASEPVSMTAEVESVTETSVASLAAEEAIVEPVSTGEELESVTQELPTASASQSDVDLEGAAAAAANSHGVAAELDNLAWEDDAEEAATNIHQRGPDGGIAIVEGTPLRLGAAASAQHDRDGEDATTRMPVERPDTDAAADEDAVTGLHAAATLTRGPPGADAARLRLATPRSAPAPTGIPSPFPPREDDTPATVPRAQATTATGRPAPSRTADYNLILAAIAAAAVIAFGLWSTRAEAPSVLHITTSPADANVLLDGRVVSSTSPHVVSVPYSEQRHVLAVQREGYQGWQTMVRLGAGQKMRLPVVELRPAEHAAAGPEER